MPMYYSNRRHHRLCPLTHLWRDLSFLVKERMISSDHCPLMPAVHHTVGIIAIMATDGMDIRGDITGTTVIRMVIKTTRIQMAVASGMLMEVVMGIVMVLTVKAVIAVDGIIDTTAVTEDDVIIRLPVLVPVPILQTPMIPQIQSRMLPVLDDGITRGT